MEVTDWVLNSNIYEVNLRQYTSEGTFAAFSRHMLRLRDMGIEILWFMPITPISMLGRKGTLGSYYACSSYTKTNSEYGSVADFKQLVQQAHKLGFKVLIDWVANHTGWDHEWVQAHPDFYKKNAEGNFFDAFGWEDVIDLDYSNQQMRAAMVQAMQFWVTECDIDGFRCDMAHLVPLDFWMYARPLLDNHKKLFWLAETEDNNYYHAFDATYAWELLHSMEQLYSQEVSLQQLIEVLNKYQSFPKNALRLLFTSNHDENSHSGCEWERMGEGAKAFAVLCATWRLGLPLIYSGQEMPNHKRLLFFDKDEIEWTGKFELHIFYKTLMRLRKMNNAMSAGEESAAVIILATTAPNSILAYARTHGNNERLIILNLSPETVGFHFTDYKNDTLMKDIFSGEQYSSGEITIECWGFRVFTPS